MDPKIHDALGGGYMNPLARYYDSLSQKFSNKEIKARQRDAVKNIASPAVMRKIGMAKQGMAEGSLEASTPNPVVVIQDLNGKILDKVNLSVAVQKYKLGNPQDIKNQLAHQNYTTIGNYVVVSPMSGQPQDATTQSMAEGICSLAEAEEIFNDFERVVAARGLTEDIYDTVTDEDIIRETAAWRRKEGKSKKGGLNAKGVASYRRENPGSKLQMAVTTKPSKLKPGSKAAKRRKSFCARMSGVKGPAKKPNGKPTRKTLALRKWNC
jgi:hypothetical protein